MQKIWEIFPALARAVRNDHEEAGLTSHHDWIHAFRVGQVAYLIGQEMDPDGNHFTSGLAGAAGLCHNADKLLQKQRGVGRSNVSDGIVGLVVDQLSAEEMFTSYNDRRSYTPYIIPDMGKRRRDIVVNAVLRHAHCNSADDDDVTIVLMDADRVVNLDADLFIRSGQHYHDLPAVDYRHLTADPEATYRWPRSVLKDIAYSLEWADDPATSPVGCRTRLGQKMARERAATFRMFFQTLEHQLYEEGILPYLVD